MSKTVKAFVVAGGGSGGGQSKGPAGGSGGVLYDPAYVLTSGSYPITIGLGATSLNANGTSSSFGTMNAIGGGGAGITTGYSGGSGGGGYGGPDNSTDYPGGSGTAGQGYAGGKGIRSYCGSSTRGSYGGAGGGAAGAGGTDCHGIGGGAGIANPISGSTAGYFSGGSYYVAGGGGTNGSSSGGIGQTSYGGGGNTGEVGKNGVVVISLVTADFAGSTGGTITTSGIYTIHTFTTNDVFTVTYLTTDAVSDIAYNTATASGEIFSGGGPIITERGFVWSIATTPTTGDFKTTVAGTTGTFSASMTGLDPSTLYYVRSYLINANGQTLYGDQVTFTTLAVPANTIVKDIDGIQGQRYAVRFTVGGTTGSLGYKCGSDAYQNTAVAGQGVTTIASAYSGSQGLIFTSSVDFDGTLDDVMWVAIENLDDANTIDWTASGITTIYPINSSVKFKRVEDQQVNKFQLYRYLDAMFKDLDGYVTVTITDEQNDLSSNKTKTFVVGDGVGTVSPFVKKRISLLSKDQAILVSFSNNNLSETFTICQYGLTGYDQPERLYKLSKLISM